MNTVLCAIKTFVLSIVTAVTARDVVVAAVFLVLASLIAWLITRPQRKKDDERWKKLPGTIKNINRELLTEGWQMARPGEPVPQWVQVKMDALAAGAAQTSIALLRGGIPARGIPARGLPKGAIPKGPSAIPKEGDQKPNDIGTTL